MFDSETTPAQRHAREQADRVEADRERRERIEQERERAAKTERGRAQVAEMRRMNEVLRPLTNPPIEAITHSAALGTVAIGEFYVGASSFRAVEGDPTIVDGALVLQHGDVVEADLSMLSAGDRLLTVEFDIAVELGLVVTDIIVLAPGSRIEWRTMRRQDGRPARCDGSLELLRVHRMIADGERARVRVANGRNGGTQRVYGVIVRRARPGTK